MLGDGLAILAIPLLVMQLTRSWWRRVFWGNR